MGTQILTATAEKSHRAMPSLKPDDQRFLELLARLRPYGGMLSDDEVRCVHQVCRLGRSVGRGLLSRELVAVRWRHRFWLPMFQFRLPRWEPAPEVGKVVAELVPVLTGFELLEWFTTPNPWLSGKLPLEMIEVNHQRVLHAAQADRFAIAF